MNARNRSIILVNVKYQCPLCPYYCYFKSTLRSHLARDHTDTEGEKYIAKELVQIECSGNICKIKK